MKKYNNRNTNSIKEVEEFGRTQEDEELLHDFISSLPVNNNTSRANDFINSLLVNNNTSRANGTKIKRKITMKNKTITTIIAATSAVAITTAGVFFGLKNAEASTDLKTQLVSMEYGTDVYPNEKIGQFKDACGLKYAVNTFPVSYSINSGHDTIIRVLNYNNYNLVAIRYSTTDINKPVEAVIIPNRPEYTDALDDFVVAQDFNKTGESEGTIVEYDLKNIQTNCSY